ncbi:Uncharacterized protein SCF082_LOCUS25594 [Durusdinium trenchii]|uniref:Carboxypeptidase regulatory-like domain-containing protein n=1 Tax=Durusdinium trenchii TaxID=1381693 RepID=A0ABP0M2M3_9DINO
MRDRPPAHLSIPRAALAPRSRYAATPFVAIAAEEAFRSAMKSVRPLELTFQRLGAGRPGRLNKPFDKNQIFCEPSTPVAAKVAVAMGSGASAGTAESLPWPPGYRVAIYPGATLPTGLSLGAPVASSEKGMGFWRLGGEAKARLRILEDPGKLLELKEPFTVGVCFRAGEHRVLGWDSVLQGDDNKHWLAFRSDENKLGLLKGDDYEELPAEFLQQGWVQVFLRSVEGGTSVLAVDAEGLLDLGLCPVSLLGSKLRACGWASNELDLAALVLWDRCLSWTELQTSLAPAVVAAPEAVHVLGSSITGQVVDLEGHPVSNVNIKWKMNACTSDLEGHFQMDDDSTDVPDTVLREVSGCSTVSFECEGFAPTTMKASESFQVVLRPLSATATMDPKEGGLVEDPKSGSSLTVPKDALAYPDGRPATGPVTLRLSCLDVTDPKALASMPGDFTAQAADGSTVMLESLGAAWINATDEQGEELQVREGSEMILDLHTTATANAQKLGATAELWSFDEQSGQWRAEVADLELDGVPAENSLRSTARSAVTEEASAAGRRSRPRKKKMGPGKFEGDYDPDAREAGWITPEAFMQKLQQEGEKSLAAPVKKFGYWNMDLALRLSAYSSPNKAVLLQGTVVDKNSKPMPTVQIWGTGKSYYGRSPDTTSGEGRFEALMVQFESSVDIEVQRLDRAAPDGTSIRFTKLASQEAQEEVIFEISSAPQLDP